jgi:hypothetical protein
MELMQIIDIDFGCTWKEATSERVDGFAGQVTFDSTQELL